MGAFYNVQRGQFVPGEFHPKSLTGCSGAVKLDRMAVPFFDTDTVSKAYRRIMYDYPHYDIFSTGIRTEAGDELKVFARRDRASATIAEIKKFIQNPWKLSDYSYLPCVIKATDDFPINFWWAMDFPAKGMLSDWMAFLDINELDFKVAINSDYFHWWLEIPYQTRQLIFAESQE